MIIEAVIDGNLEGAKIAIEKGEDVNAKDRV